MTDSLPSDHDTVTTSRGTVETVGSTSRREVQLPEDGAPDPGSVVWFSLEGESGYGRIEHTLAGTPVLRAVRANRRQAREEEGPNRLGQWLERRGIEPGEVLHLDTLTPGRAYGLRRPGERVVYAPPDPRDGSLADIARDLAGDEH